MTPGHSAIRTPDQRLRVFVSSTLHELAAERAVARAAIENLRLAPVMFELGARPHPPQELYRSYLEQSDVFVGIYAESYGWVAPGSDISGLEDEYALAPPEMPKLIYIRKPAPAREPRLVGLLDRVMAEGRASYKSFETAADLGELIEADLATLLAERFDRGHRERQEQVELPAPLSSLIGRELELDAVRRLLDTESVRLVTLTGPGGIGKTRLAIEAAQQATDSTAFVDLESVTSAAGVPSAIALALGVRDIGDAPIIDKLATALRETRTLVVIDNFEQVIEAAPLLTELLERAPGLTLLVTSRALLRLSGEHTVEVGPLAVSPAVELFVARARAVKPDFELTEDNSEAVSLVCEALDGVPLAIELAAARIRTLPPAAMLERLSSQLPLLVGGVRDLPARQQALRATIEWSTELLGEQENLLLGQLGAFAGPFSLEAVESIATGDDVLSTLGTLIDNSLVRQREHGQHSYFGMLTSVREFARDRLDASGEAGELRARHAAYYLGLAERLELMLEGEHQREWIARLTEERENLRAVCAYYRDQREWDNAAHFAWMLYLYWWIGGHLGEVAEEARLVLEGGDELSDLSRGIGLYYTNAITFWQHGEHSVIDGLVESASLFHAAGERSGEALARISLALAVLASPSPDTARADDELEAALALFRANDDTWGEGMALVTLGRVAIFAQEVPTAIERFEQTLAITRAQGDELGTCIALHHLGWARMLTGDLLSARDLFEQSLAGSDRMKHAEGVAYGLEGLVAVAAASGDIDRAGRLLGASEVLRERTGIYNAPSFSFHRQVLEPVLASEAAPALETARLAGRAMSADAAVAYAEQVA